MAAVNSVGNSLTGLTGTGTFVGANTPTLITPILGVATATSLVFSPTTNGIIGTTTNNDAAAGSVGEFASATRAIGSAFALTTGTPLDIVSISLTAGDYDVWGDAHFTGGATTLVQDCIGWISTTSATVPAPSLYNIVNYGVTGVAVFANASLGFSVPQVRISLSTTTTVYMSVQADFNTSTCSGFGNIYARRRR